MTFIQGFYSFDLELTDSDRGVFFKGRIKLMRHENETLENLYARFLAYIHSYDPGLQLSKEFQDPKEPAIFKKNILESYERWIEVGSFEPEKLEKALRKHDTSQHAVYWYSLDQVRNFSASIYGHIVTGLSSVRFWLISPEMITALNGIDQRTTEWSITAVDQVYYITVEGQEFELNYEPIAISTHGVVNLDVSQ